MHIKLKLGIANALRYTGALALANYLDSGQRDMILTLHRVLPPEECQDCYDKHMVLSTTTFEDLLIFLKQNYEVVSLNTLLSSRTGPSSVQRIALTFDDGWKDTFQHAFPLLLRHQVPATVFICSSLIDSSAMLPEERLTHISDHCSAKSCTPAFLQHLAVWGGAERLAAADDWRSFTKTIPLSAKLSLTSHLELTYGLCRPKVERFMTWQEVQIMVSHGIEIGSHTANHATLNVENREVIQRELSDSRDTIEAKLGIPPRYLSYPNGSYSHSVVLLAKEARYSHAFTTDHGRVKAVEETLTIPRIAIDNTLITDEKGRMHAARTALHLSSLRDLFARRSR